MQALGFGSLTTPVEAGKGRGQIAAVCDAGLLPSPPSPFLPPLTCQWATDCKVRRYKESIKGGLCRQTNPGMILSLPLTHSVTRRITVSSYLVMMMTGQYKVAITRTLCTAPRQHTCSVNISRRIITPGGRRSHLDFVSMSRWKQLRGDLRRGDAFAVAAKEESERALNHQISS